VDKSAVEPVTPEVLEWADLIFVVEKSHRVKLSKEFRAHLKNQKIVVLGIPDKYRYMDPELVELLEKLVRMCLRLKKHHHELWVSLGSPMPGLANRYKDQTRLLRFLRLRQYESLNDEKTKRLAAGTRLASRVFLAYVFVGSAVVFGIVLIGKYWKTL